MNLSSESTLHRQSTSISRELSCVLTIGQRDVIKLLRDRTRLAISLAFPIMLIVGLGSILRPTVGKVTGLDTVTLAFTGVLAATMFQSAAAGMMSIVEDRETDFAQELFVAPVSRLAIVAGKVMGESLVALCQGAGVLLLALPFGLRLSLRQVVSIIPPCIACCLLGAAFGLATLAALPNQRAALQIMAFVILPQYFLSGVVAPLHGLPGYLNVLSWLMPLRYGVNLTRAAFYAGTSSYGKVVVESPLVDLAVMAALFCGLMVVGAAIFEYRERRR